MSKSPLNEARFYRREDGGRVVCELCPHGCVIPTGRYGVCKVRQNVDGELRSLNYGAVTSLALDPVEKKPLFHVEPGGILLSVGSYGCNLQCEFCQNWQISQSRPACHVISPRELVFQAVKERRADKRVVGIAYTYNEPTVGLEFVLDCARLAKEQGFRNVMVTNGYISESALEETQPLMDAFNVDVKAWNEDFYRKMVKGRLRPVKQTVEFLIQRGTWVEVTCLVIPGKNDRDEDMEGLSRWLASLNPEAPLHLSRYFPAYKSSEQVTPLETLERLRDIARRNLCHVYIGNAWKTGYADTVCAKCGEVLLERGGMELEASHLAGKRCPKCQRPLLMVGDVWLNK